MSRSSFARCLLTCLVLCALLALSPHAAQTPRDATSADARLRALYTEEWNWRQKELARVGDQPGEAGRATAFPRSTPRRNRRGSPTGRKTLATLDGIPFDQLSPEEKVNAQIFRTSHPRARQRREGSAPTRRRSTATRSSGPTSRRGRASRPPAPIARISGACATCRATSTSRSPTCGPASRAATASRACRSSDATRRSSRT